MVALLAGCADDGDAPADATSTSTTAVVTDVTTTAVATSTAPPTTEPAPRSAVDVSSVAVESLGPTDGAEAPYAETEYLVSGTAALYAGPAVGPVEVASEGNAYVTRIVVRRPVDPAGFSGRVVVEPFNTSAGSDAAAAYGFLGSMIVDQGDVWIGVSVRWISMTSLQESDPERYASLSIPSNGLAWDILGQLGGLVKEGDPRSPIADLDVEHVYMAGYSQNGIDTATFASAFGERMRMTDGSAIYDGHLPLAHSGSMTPIDSGAVPIPSFEFVPIGATDVPVIDVESESDVLGFVDPAYTNPGHASVRRDDSDEPDDLYRLYEIPGGSHVKGPMGCDHDGTSFPLEYFIRAAYRLLIGWAEDGVVPPRAERIAMEVIDTASTAARDEYGNALGGVRSPFLDVPVAAYRGGDTGSPICGLAGIETLFDRATLERLHGDRAGYLEAFETSLADAVDAGFLLAEDRDAIIAYAEERWSAAFDGE